MVLRIACMAALVLVLVIACSPNNPVTIGALDTGPRQDVAKADPKQQVKPRVDRSGEGPKTSLESEKTPQDKPRVRRLGERPRAFLRRAKKEAEKNRLRRVGDKPETVPKRLEQGRNTVRVLRFGTRPKTAVLSSSRRFSITQVRLGSLTGPVGRQIGFSQFESLPRGVTGFALPDQTRFPRHYRFNRRWATGATCPPVTRGIRYGFQRLYVPYGHRRGSLLCGQFEGGRTVLLGSPWRSHIPPGLTVEQGSPWRSHIRSGLTVRQGSPWRGRIPGGLTVDQGSSWASSFKNWRFSAYDPGQFPRQSDSRPPRRVQFGTTFAKRIFPVQRAPRYRSRIRPGRSTKTKRSPWRSRIQNTRTARRGSLWASRTRY